MACHTSRSSNGPAPVDEAVANVQDTVLIRLHKGSCYGQCPTYQLELHASGRAVLSPRRFMPVDSTRTAVWPMEEILSAFDAAGFDRFSPEYMQPIADIPTFRLSYRGKEVKWNGRAPQPLLDLVTLLDRYTVKEGWLEEERAFRAKPAYRVDRELIVQLKPGTDVPLWLSLYDDVGMEILRKIVPSGEYLLVTYDQGRVEPDALLERVRADQQVVLANFNKEVDLRD